MLWDVAYVVDGSKEGNEEEKLPAWDDMAWLEVVRSASRTSASTRAFLRVAMRALFVGADWAQLTPVQRRGRMRVDDDNDGGDVGGLRRLCRATPVLVHTWLLLEVQATEAEAGTNSSKVSLLQPFLASCVVEAHPFRVRYVFDSLWLCGELKRAGQVEALLTLLDSDYLRHQSTKIQSEVTVGGGGGGDEEDKDGGVSDRVATAIEASTTHLLRVSTACLTLLVPQLRAAEADNAEEVRSVCLHRISDVFELVSSASDVGSTVALVAESTSLVTEKGREQKTEPNAETTPTLVETLVKRATIRGVLRGAGAHAVVQVLDAAGPAFWGALPQRVLEELVECARNRTQRQAHARKIIVTLDKYLWSRKPAALPPQLRALRHCERSLQQAPHLMGRIMSRVPRRARSMLLRTGHGIALGEDEEGGEEERGYDQALPTFHADEGGQWGAVVTVSTGSGGKAGAGSPSSSSKGGEVDRGGVPSNLLACQASGAFIESGRSAVVFPCGHVVMARRMVYDACPCCPLEK